jgi:hypothetical protein
MDPLEWARSNLVGGQPTQPYVMNFLDLCKPTNAHTICFYHILLITKMFRSLLRSSSGQLYKSAKNTINCQTAQVTPPSVIFY